MKTIKSVIGPVALIAALTVGQNAVAATFVLSGSPNSPLNGTVGNQRIFTADGITLTASGRSRQGGNTNDAYLGRYVNGLGVTNSNEDGRNRTHVVDNVVSKDFVLFQFDQDVKITEIALSSYGDTDITIGYGTNWNDNLLDINDVTTQNPGIDVYDDTWRIFASLQNQDGKFDGFKIKSVTVGAVPLPAAAWLFGSALLGMVGFGARRRLTAS